ncbi:MAG: alpha/beta hydrolase [Lactobacillus sp.]|nr:alpha/beta hydrolase [Lactobacillus sp.]
MYFYTKDRTKLHYTDTGDIEKIPIIAIPGIGGSAKMWLKMIELFKQDYRVIVLDPRNQGRSQRTYKGERISTHAADVEDLINYLKIKKFIAIGNSMGAANFWSYLSIFGSEKMLAMVDLDQSPKMISDDTWKFGFKDLSWNNYPEYLKLDFGKAFYAHIDDEMFLAAKQEYQKYPYDPEKNYNCLIDHSLQDWRDIIMDVQIPMLIIAGKESPYFDYHFVDAVKLLNNKIETSIISNCGHLIQAEQPDEMYRIVIKFLKANLNI